MSYKNTLTMLILLIMNQWIAGQQFEDIQKISRSYKAVAGMRIDINNKYGSVLVSAWDKDSVRIEITRRVSEKNEDRFNKIKSNIDFKFSATSNQVVAETVFGDKYSSMYQSVKEATNYLAAAESRSKIDYKIYVPTHININIINKYGDVAIPSVTGSVNVNLSNGNLQMRDINGTATLNLAFGDAQIKSIKGATATLNFVNLNLEQSDNLAVDSKSSNISLSEIGTVKLTSRRDQIKVLSANTLSCDAYFTKLSVMQLKQSASLKLTYGELTELTSSGGFQQIDIISTACDINLKLLSPLPYSALLQGPAASLHLPEHLKAESTDYQKTVGSTPTRFIFQKRGVEDKVRINISDAELNILHQ